MKYLLCYIEIFMLLFWGSGYFALVSGKVSGITGISIQFTTFIIIFITISFKKKIDMEIRSFLLLIFMMLVVLINLLFRQESAYYYIIILCAIVNGYLIISSFSVNQFIKTYINILYYLAIASLICYCITLFIPVVWGNLPIEKQFIDGMTIRNAWFSIVQTGAWIKRNYGIFWEPGAYQVFLNLSIIFELFYSKQKSKRKICILSLALVTTFSTTGYIVYAIILIAFVITFSHSVINKEYLKKAITILVGIGLIILIVYRLPEKYTNNVFNKATIILSGKHNDNASASARVNAIIYPLEEIEKHPIKGIGFQKYWEMVETKCNGLATCTPFNWIALFGIFWGVICIMGCCKFMLIFKAKKPSQFLLILALVLMIISEDFLLNPFIYVIIFFGIKGWEVEK